jgi:hypothetical protein
MLSRSRSDADAPRMVYVATVPASIVRPASVVPSACRRCASGTCTCTTTVYTYSSVAAAARAAARAVLAPREIVLYIGCHGRIASSAAVKAAAATAGTVQHL